MINSSIDNLYRARSTVQGSVKGRPRVSHILINSVWVQHCTPAHRSRVITAKNRQDSTFATLHNSLADRKAIFRSEQREGCEVQ